MSVALMLAASPAAANQSAGEPFDTLEERLATPSFEDPLADDDGGAIVVLIAYNRTNFFIDEEGHYRGFEYDILKGYESFVNENKDEASKHHFLVFVPMQLEDILPALADGRGDMAAANLTVTEERLRSVDFSEPYLPQVNEVVVTRKNGPPLAGIEGLAGRRIYVLAGSSYVGHLDDLNDRFDREGLDQMEIVEAEPNLDHSGIFQLIDSGAVDFTVADEHIAGVWEPVFDNLSVRSDLVINRGGRVAWAIRKNTPKFKASVNDYVETIKKGTLKGNMAFDDYYRNRRWLNNPLDATELAKLDEVVHHMKHYAAEYDLDWIAVAAQAYQESQLDQSKISPAGAIGIMQLLPGTAADEPIGIENIDKVENNIHAGIKYLSFLRRNYFDDPDIAPTARKDFIWAAYNAGPARIQAFRRRAAERGYDHNRWFDNVEHMASEAIGPETVEYVANINKYYIAYKFALERRERQPNRSEPGAGSAQARKALEAWRRSYANERR